MGVRKPKKKWKNKVFDYIVIGAGTAGGVIAKKLTDDPHTSVLVLETGVNSTAHQSSPYIFDAVASASDNKFAFNYQSSLEPSLQRQLATVNGRVIGGGSEVNYMLAVRGSKELYDQWRDLTGEHRWGYREIRQLFMEDETYTGQTQSPSQRGRSGPVFIRQQHTPQGGGLPELLAEATQTVLGIPKVVDYNTGVRDCTFSKGQLIQREEADGTMTRSSTATGYLNDSIVTQGDKLDADEWGVGRRKLVLFANTTVNKVIFKKKKGHLIAAGVEYVKEGVSYKRFARKGVIVSAGFHSAVILQRSGIGHPMDLMNAGIKPLVENPNVGYQLQTHAYAGLGVEVDTSQLLPLVEADPNQPLLYGAFVAEHRNSQEGRRLQISGAPAPLFLPNPVVIERGWELDVTRATNIVSFGLIDLNPTSKGTIMAAHNDPAALPSFSFNPLQPTTNDLDFLVDQYINMYKIIVEARKQNSGIHRVVFPDEGIFMMPDEERRRELRQFVRSSYSNFFHYGGQCKMADSEENGVVNGQLDVFGTMNLKVADLSIAPILPDGNTSVAARMIGLNAVRFIQDNPHPYVLDDNDFEDL
ncbi:GMC family oxidoreductase [Neobacillus sp. Marseille-QA0830]